MSRVHILPEEIVAKIAAGEVIERPASVVKELVENALDAGADTIELSLKDAGRTLIQIKDNGHGIERDDFEKIFLRHATSKIANAQDLFAIHSLGFRGEALYSIAAIADVTLTSKTKEQDSAWQIHMRAGQKYSLRPSAMGGCGTEIQVKELFYNTPARRKFLRSNTTEINQILNIFIPYTLLFPKIRFRLKHQDKDLLDLPPADNFKDRAAHCLRLEEKYLLENHRNDSAAGLSIRIILGDMNIQRARRDMQFIFVNNRPVQNKNISFHMNNVFKLIMPEDTYPFFAVYINLPADELDVNVHPAKREVKMKDEQKICLILRGLGEETLMKEGKIKEAGAVAQHARQGSSPPETLDFGTDIEARGGAVPAEFRRPFSVEPEGFYIPADNPVTQKQENLQKKLGSARFIGNFINKFLLFATDQSLVVIDQHAAQERIAYEQLIVQMQKGTLEVQYLLSPILVKLSVQESLAYEECQEKLNELGLSSSKFDLETIAIHSHPQLIKDPEKAVREILSGENISRSDHAALARRACRSSIMAGDRLNKEQAEYQLKSLLKCLDPFTCPHGRPTTIELTENFLDKQFLRTR